MSQRLAFTGKQSLSFEDITAVTELEPRQIRAKGICSLMSTGTENIVYNRLFEKGSHWDNWVAYPFYPGYAWIGEVTEIGAEVNSTKIGQRVAIRKGHAQEHVVHQDDCIVLPDGLDPEEAIWFALAKICYSGAMAAKYQLGINVLIIGGGPIGQMTTRWARCAGAGKIVVVDPLPLRQEFARSGGAHQVIGKRLDEASADILVAFGGKKPEIVIDSTGVAAVFQEALKICADKGTLVILGDTGAPTEQHLSSDVITRGLHIVGAHDCHFPTAPVTTLFWSLVQDGRFQLHDLITHRFPFSAAKEAYRIANEQRGETMGILFKYQS